MFENYDKSIYKEYQIVEDKITGKFGIRDRSNDRIIIRPVFDRIAWDNPFVVFTLDNKMAVYYADRIVELYGRP